MSQSVRIILFNADEAAAPELRKQLTSLPQVRVVAELDEPSLLPHAVAQFPADVLLAHLDPQADVVLECIRQLMEAVPETVIFALSGNTDGRVVLRAMRAGVREYLVKPLKSEELTDALERVVAGRSKTKQTGRLISVMGSSGGVGATTLAVNLGVELAGLAGADQKVALVDLDFRFGQVATMLDLHTPFTVADLCSTAEELDPQMIQKALVRHESGVHVLARPHSFAQAELITAAHCASVLSTLQEMCAYVVVDGPTRHDPAGRVVLDASDVNLLIVQLLVTSVRNADRMLQELAAQGFNTDRISLVCNRLGREAGHLEISHVEQTLNRKMYLTIPDDWRSVSSSVNIGKPLKAEHEKTRVRLAIQALAQKIHAPESAAPEADSGGGLIGKLFKKTAKAPPAASDAAAAPVGQVS